MIDNKNVCEKCGSDEFNIFTSSGGGSVCIDSVCLNCNHKEELINTY